MTRRSLVGCAPALLGALDFGFLALAAPAIAADLGVGSAYAWLFTAGSLAYGAVVMPAQALAGRVAAGRLLAAGLAIAGVGVAALALAGAAAVALAGRVLFGVGSGLAAPPALVILGGERAEGAFAWMGGAIALGFSIGVLLAASTTWRASLGAVLALLIAVIVAASTISADPPMRRRASGALRLGAATAASGAFLAALEAETQVAAVALAVAVALAIGGWRAARPWLPSGGRLLTACVAGAATTMSGVGGTVLLGRELGASATLGDGLVLATFGLATVPAVKLARALDVRVGAPVAASAGLAAQAAGLTLIAVAVDRGAALVPAVALFGAGHVVANAGAAATVMHLVGEAAAGLYVTSQYLAGGIGPLVVLGVAGRHGAAGGMVLAAAIAVAGAATAAAHRGAPTQSARRSA